MVWGLIGVMTNASKSGVTIGPPAAREYAVDPLGVWSAARPGPLGRDMEVIRRNANGCGKTESGAL